MEIWNDQVKMKCQAVLELILEKLDLLVVMELFVVVE